MTYHLVYSSLAVTPFTDAELLELLRKARVANASLGVTGLLLYKQGGFMQALEGTEGPVLALYRLIRKDLRHHRIITLLSSPTTERLFPDWSMGFQHLGEADISSVTGYNPTPNLPLSDDRFPWKTSVAMRLLAGFAKKG